MNPPLALHDELAMILREGPIKVKGPPVFVARAAYVVGCILVETERFQTRFRFRRFDLDPANSFECDAISAYGKLTCTVVERSQLHTCRLGGLCFRPP